MLNNMMDQEGTPGTRGQIRSTPLPLVYATHLRTFLLLFLISLPYGWYRSWGWSTIPIIFITTPFAMLGLE
jgi:putative membrane protein